HTEIKAFHDQTREGHLVGALGRSDPLLNPMVLGVVSKTDHLGGIIQNGIAADLTKDPGEIGVGLQQPAPECDSVGFVDNAIWIHRVQLAEHASADQVGVKRWDAVSSMGADKRKVAHSQLPTVTLVDQ